MKEHKGQPATSGTMALLEAILGNDKPLRFSSQDEETRQETMRQDEYEEYPWGKSYRMVRKHWTDQAVFRYNGRRNAKRKGTIRNNQEASTIARIKG